MTDGLTSTLAGSFLFPRLNSLQGNNTLRSHKILTIKFIVDDTNVVQWVFPNSNYYVATSEPTVLLEASVFSIMYACSFSVSSITTFNYM